MVVRYSAKQPHCGLLTTMRRLMVSGLLGATASRLTSWRFPTNCAFAASGQVAVARRPAMNSRRFM